MPVASNVCQEATLRHWPQNPNLITDAFKILSGEGAKGNPRTVATNWTNFKGKRTLNRDRGCWQISHLWHPHVSDEQAFDPDFAAKYAFKLYEARGNWSAWCSADVMGLGKSC